MFDLHPYLAARQPTVEAWLDAALPAATEPPAVLHEAMRYAVFTGGKRLRPVLATAAAEAAGAPPETARAPAVAVELLHTYTLIHDDLPCMDDDDFRRGKPTCHVAFGEANAVLAGDALQALAFELLAAAPAGAALVAELARAAGSRGVIGGQVADLAASTGGACTAEGLTFIHTHKTADLFRAALRMGALAGGAAPAQVEALGVYGLNLGLAFQIVDDLLDEATDAERKDPHRNRRHREENNHGGTEARRNTSHGAAAHQAVGNFSCLSFYTPDEARRQAAALIAAARQALAAFPVARTQPLAAVADFVLSRKA